MRGEPRSEYPDGLLVSVIIPCYNQGRFLSEAIDSVLEQTYPHWEVIVVDDESTDQTAAIASGYGHRIRYVWRKNGGAAAARNTGILASCGEFLLFLDADDYLAPDTLEKQVAAARAEPTGSIFHTACQYIDLERRPVTRFEAHRLGDDAFHALLADNPFCPHCLMVRRSAFADAGLFDCALASSEDWDMWIRLAAAGHRFVAVPDTLVYYRYYAGSKSKNPERMWATGLAVIHKNRIHHGKCSRCRKETARGVSRVRSLCEDLLTRELYWQKATCGVAASIARAARALRRDPALAGWPARAASRCVRNRWAHRASVQGELSCNQ